MLELLGPAVSIATAALLAQSCLRSWRAENKFLKWGGTVLSALFSDAKRQYGPDNVFCSAVPLPAGQHKLAAE